MTKQGSYGPQIRRMQRECTFVDAVGPYNKICPRCSSRYFLGAETGWIDIERCAKCGGRRAELLDKRALLDAELLNATTMTERLRVRAKILTLKGQLDGG